MQKLLYICLLAFVTFFCGKLFAQENPDSLTLSKPQVTDTSKIADKKKFDPRIATRRSAMIPGWGQIYNKKYWKLPLIYGALGTTAGIFFYNVKNYKLLRLAYIYKSDTIPGNDVLIDPKYQKYSAGALRSYRGAFRQNVDYSVLFFLVFWGLNVVDATVDGHLKQFDVNENLSLEIKPGYSPMANTAGVSLVLDIHSGRRKTAK